MPEPILSSKNIHLKLLSSEWWQFCPSRNVLRATGDTWPLCLCVKFMALGTIIHDCPWSWIVGVPSLGIFKLKLAEWWARGPRKLNTKKWKQGCTMRCRYTLRFFMVLTSDTPPWLNLWNVFRTCRFWCMFRHNHSSAVCNIILYRTASQPHPTVFSYIPWPIHLYTSPAFWNCCIYFAYANSSTIWIGLLYIVYRSYQRFTQRKLYVWITPVLLIYGRPFVKQGAVSIRKTVLPGMAIPMLKIRRPNGRLIFNMEIAIRR